VTFIIRLGYIRKHARQRFNHELQQQSHGTPLNSAEMQSFATYVMAGSLFSADEGEDAIEPLKKLISHIEPLKLPEQPSAVGIPFDTLDQQQEMKTLMAIRSIVSTRAARWPRRSSCSSAWGSRTISASRIWHRCSTPLAADTKGPVI